MKLENVEYAADLARHLERTDDAIKAVDAMVPAKDDIGTTYAFLDIWECFDSDGSPSNDQGRPAIDVVVLLAGLKESRATLVKELIELGVEVEDGG